MHTMNVYEQVTERIIAQLEAGVIPWRKEWKSTGHSHLPVNYTTKKPYRGINVLLLMSACFDDSRFLTYKQAQSIGAQVRKGEKGIQIVFWSTFDGKEKETDDARKIPFLRTYTVFHVSQCDGIPADLPFDAPIFEPIPAAQLLADNYLTREHIELKHGGDRAFYSPALDYVQMPSRESFASPDAYYSTLFHEMGHSTGHPSRLDREKSKGGNAFGSELYSKEELVAEFTAAYLCADTGISNALVEANHAAYIQSWLRALKNDKNLLVSAAQKAQHAADRIADRSPVARESSADAA
jgi:antirestriction protein ArdC